MSELQVPGGLDRLLARMEAGRTLLYAGLRDLNDAQWREPITAADWSICDHLAHVAVWMEGVEAMLNGRSRWDAMGGGPPDPGAGFDALNEQLRAPHRAGSTAEIRAWLDTVHERMVATWFA
ncbi:MAG: ClbS/DfsB family four-helix bundle protein [Oscillochloris sp.]|nr:ClbS/DfsB family four-helix bundle protein [Oscillochloris sp.]